MEQKILEFFYKWDRFEKQNGVDIIDFNLLQQQDQYAGEFTSREEVKKILDSLIHEYNQLPDKNTFIAAKLNASLYFLRALMGEQFSFNEYVENTIGVSPLYIPEKEIQEQLEATRSLYKDLGYEYTREDLEKFTQNNKLSKDEIERTFTEAKNTFVPKILKWLGLDISLQYKTQLVDVNDYWMNWTTTDKEGNLLF